jgi:hypothetical protein
VGFSYQRVSLEAALVAWMLWVPNTHPASSVDQSVFIDQVEDGVVPL